MVEVLETVGQGVKGVDMIYTCQSPEFCFRTNQPCRSKMQPHHAIPRLFAALAPYPTLPLLKNNPSKQHQNQIQSATPLEMELFNFNIPISLPITMRFRRAGALSTLAATPPLPPDSRSHDMSAQRTLSNPTDRTPSHAPRRAPPSKMRIQ